jgi:hypothetical protein
VHGLFTYCLVQELAGAGDTPRYAELMDRVRRRVRLTRSTQTPVIEGPLDDGGLFGREQRARPPSFPLADEPGLLLAGRLHGLEPEAVLEVFPEDAVGEAARSAGTIRLESVGVLEARFEWSAPPHAGCGALRAVLVEPGRSGAALGFALEPDAPDPGAQALAARLERTGRLRRAGPDEAELRLRLEPGDDPIWRAFTRAGVALPLAARAAAPDEIEELALALAVLGRAHAVQQDVQNESGPTPLEFDVRVELRLADGSWSDALPRDDAGLICLKQGEYVRWVLENRSEVALYASLLVLSPDGEINVVHRPENEDDRIPPGREVRTIAMTPVIGERSRGFYEQGLESFRWVVTTRYHDLRQLRQPAATSLERTRGVEADARAARSALSGVPWRTRTIDVRFLVEG